ncbi:MAG: hypothetical protein KBB86_03150 [Candidatus Pacebacteria bacterium]|nr:hypothetical protein [Candidatus Paceibacterota bacterium]
MEPYLEEYYGLECPICEVMRERLDKLEHELQIPIKRFEVWHNKENMDRVEALEHNGHVKVLGIPFFYNTQTGGYLCGEVSYAKLKAWALGQTNL